MATAVKKVKIESVLKKTKCSSEKFEENEQKTYPIVKWVGGKRQLMHELLKNMPKSFYKTCINNDVAVFASI